MARYFHPAQALLDGHVGCEILPSSGMSNIGQRWSHYKRAAGDNKHLYAVLNTGTFVVAVCVDSSSEFWRVTTEYRDGGALFLRYYALTAEEHALAS